MVFEHRNHILRTCILKQLCPGLGIVVLRLEHGDKVFIAKLRQRSVGGHFVRILFRPAIYICRGYHSLPNAGTE